MLASSREPRAAANTRGRDKSRPYERGARPVVNRENANPAMLQTSVGDDSISARFAAARASYPVYRSTTSRPCAVKCAGERKATRSWPVAAVRPW